MDLNCRRRPLRFPEVAPTLMALLVVIAVGCKPLEEGGYDQAAITGVDVDGKKKAMALLPVQNDPEIHIPTTQMSERAREMILKPFFALVECSSIPGADAQEVMREKERLAGARNLFINKDRRLFSFGQGDNVLLSDCSVVGDRLMSWPTFVKGFITIAGIPTNAEPSSPVEIAASYTAYKMAQTMFLAIRGPYYFDSRGAGPSDVLPRLLEMANAYAGYDGKRRNQIINWFQVGDSYFNPCHSNIESVWYVRKWRNQNYSCERMASDNHVADYRVGSDALSYPDAKLALITEIAAMHSELYQAPTSMEDKLWDALTTLETWESYRGPGQGAAAFLSRRGAMNLTGENPLLFSDGKELAGGSFAMSKVTNDAFSLTNEAATTANASTARYLAPIVTALSGVLMAAERQSTTADFGGGLVTTRVAPPTLKDRLLVLSEDKNSFTANINGQQQKVSEADYYRMLMAQQNSAQNPTQAREVNQHSTKLFDNSAVQYVGQHRTGSNEYKSDSRRVYINSFENRKAAYERGDISLSELQSGNATVWRTTGKYKDASIEKLESGNANRLFDTYQVGNDGLAFRFNKPGGGDFTVFGGQNEAAKKRGYAVPDAQLQEKLLTAAHQNFAQYADAAATAQNQVNTIQGQVNNFGQVTGNTWWNRMGQYGTQISTASQGLSALNKRNSYGNTLQNYSNNYFTQMRGKSENSLGGQSLNALSAMARLSNANREAVMPSQQIQQSFSQAGASAFGNAAWDSWNTASTQVQGFADQHGGGLSGFTAGVATSVNNYASQAMNYMTDWAGGSSAETGSQSVANEWDGLDSSFLEGL